MMNDALRVPSGIVLCAALVGCGPAGVEGPEESETFELRIHELADTTAPSGSWTYAVEAPRASRLELALLDVRHPEEALTFSTEVEAGRPFTFRCQAPTVLGHGAWSESDPPPSFAWMVQFDQTGRAWDDRSWGFEGEGRASTHSYLPEVMVPASYGGALGPVSLSGSPPIAYGAPVVLVNWVLPPDLPVGVGRLPESGPVGEPGEPFPFPPPYDYRPAGTAGYVPPIDVADFPGAWWELRMRLSLR